MKSLHKMMIRAFTKIAKGYKWDDSKFCPNSLRGYGYRNARDWARHMAKNYELDDITMMCEGIVEIIEYAISNDIPISQHDIDEFVREEISCW